MFDLKSRCLFTTASGLKKTKRKAIRHVVGLIVISLDNYRCVISPSPNWRYVCAMILGVTLSIQAPSERRMLRERPAVQPEMEEKKVILFMCIITRAP